MLKESRVVDTAVAGASGKINRSYFSSVEISKKRNTRGAKQKHHHKLANEGLYREHI